MLYKYIQNNSLCCFLELLCVSYLNLFSVGFCFFFPRFSKVYGSKVLCWSVTFGTGVLSALYSEQVPTCWIFTVFPFGRRVVRILFFFSFTPFENTFWLRGTSFIKLDLTCFLGRTLSPGGALVLIGFWLDRLLALLLFHFRNAASTHEAHDVVTGSCVSSLDFNGYMTLVSLGGKWFHCPTWLHCCLRVACWVTGQSISLLLGVIFLLFRCTGHGSRLPYI